MNYRHAYHAGNFADVLKHIVLVRVIEYMKQKPAPFRVLDAHAGIGLYDLHSAEALRTGEWKSGIGRLLSDAPHLAKDVRHLLAPYLDVIASVNPGGTGAAELRYYPGSPLLASALMRAGDKLVVNELHPEDAATLASVFRRHANARVATTDAYQFLKASLPPPEKRGIVLVDPAYEAVDERRRLLAALAAALDRFATGTYLIWYPIKDAKPAERLERDLNGLVGRYGLKPGLDLRLQLRTPRNADALSGCGVAVLNPPHTLRTEMLHIMQSVEGILSHEAGHGFRAMDLPGNPA